MTRYEYDLLQAKLSEKLEKNPYAGTGNAKQKEGYKAGILAAKSILSAHYRYHSEEKGA